MDDLRRALEREYMDALLVNIQLDRERARRAEWVRLRRVAGVTLPRLRPGGVRGRPHPSGRLQQT